MTLASMCCRAPVHVEGDETRYCVCQHCGKGCDVVGDAVAGVGAALKALDDASNPATPSQDDIDRETGRRWREDSSLETWFPLTADKIKREAEYHAAREAELRELLLEAAAAVHLLIQRSEILAGELCVSYQPDDRLTDLARRLRERAK